MKHIKSLSIGQLFKLDKKDTKIYVRDKYGKRLKRFICYEHGDTSNTFGVKKGTKVITKI